MSSQVGLIKTTLAKRAPTLGPEKYFLLWWRKKIARKTARRRCASRFPIHQVGLNRSKNTVGGAGSILITGTLPTLLILPVIFALVPISGALNSTLKRRV